MIQITIGTSKKIKCGDFGSVGAECSLTVELETTTATTGEEIQLQISHHYQTITDAIYRQLATLEARPLEPTAPSTNGKPPAQPATPKPAAKPAAKAPAATAPRSKGTQPATPATPRPTPPQPATQRNALDAELARQFAPPTPDTDDETDDEDLGPPEELDDDTPRNGLELLGWARRQPGDAKQELATIGMHRGFPRLIKDWSQSMTNQALQIYKRTARE